MTKSETGTVPHGRLAFVRRLLEEPVPMPEPEVSDGLRRLTAIEADPQRAGAVRLSVDGIRFATIAREDAEGLRPGMPIDEALDARLQAAAATEGALRSGLASLARRAMARTDLQRRLRKKGHDPLAASLAVERLERLGLLDDAAFARTYAEQAARKGRGPVRVSRDLGVMGVERGLIQAAIAGAGLRESLAPDGDAVREIAEGRLRRLRDLDAPTARRRLLAFLARRGFQGGAVNTLVRRLVAEREIGAVSDA